MERGIEATSVETLFRLFSALGLELVVRDASTPSSHDPTPREW
jgi:hypothetical protein